MNLVKLLAAGKSIISGRKNPAYRENKNVYLPKFGEKNPFLPLDMPEPTPLPDRAALVAAKTQKLSQMAPPKAALAKPVAAVAEAKTEVKADARAADGGWKKFSPVSVWRKTDLKRGSQAPSPLQPELSLDAVKVVHNDLSDADVEVVQVKLRPASRPVRSEVPELAPAEKSWELLGERLMKVS